MLLLLLLLGAEHGGHVGLLGGQRAHKLVQKVYLIHAATSLLLLIGGRDAQKALERACGGILEVRLRLLVLFLVLLLLLLLLLHKRQEQVISPDDLLARYCARETARQFAVHLQHRICRRLGLFNLLLLLLMVLLLLLDEMLAEIEHR